MSGCGSGWHRHGHPVTRSPLLRGGTCLLLFEGCGPLDLAEIYQFSPSKRCAFDFRHPTFAYPRARHTPGAPALRTCILGTFGNCGGFRCICSIEGRGLLDLVEICLFSPSKRCAFDFRHPTFAYPRANHTPGAPALRTCIFATFGNCGGLSGRVLGNSQNSPPTLRREFRKPRQRTASPRGGFSPRGLYFRIFEFVL